MNKIIHKLIIIFLFAFFLLQLGCASITPKLDKVFRVEQVRLGELHGLRLISKENRPLEIGDEIDTDANTLITLVFPGGTEVIVKPNTLVKILDFAVELIPKPVKVNSFYQNNSFNLQQPIRLASLDNSFSYPYWLAELTHSNNNHKNTTASSNIWKKYFGELFVITKTYLKRFFKVKTQYVTAGPEGTKFLVRADNQKDVSVIVVKGVVKMESNTQRWAPIYINPREKWTARSDNPPTKQPIQQHELDKIIHPITQVERIIKVNPATPSTAPSTTATAPTASSNALALQGHRSGVNHAAFSPDGQQIVTTSNDGTARLWNPHNGQPLVKLKGHTGAVYRAAFSPNGQRIVTASKDGTARLWNANTGKSLSILQGHRGEVFHTAFSPDGRLIVTTAGTLLAEGSNDKTARLWDANSGRLITKLSGHNKDVLYATFSPDSRLVVTTSWDTTARLWNTNTGQTVFILPGHKDAVHHAAFSPDGRTVITAAADNDKTARLWDVNSGKLIKELVGHQERVWRVAFSPDGQRIVTASKDKTARLWEGNSGQQIAVLKGHTARVNHAAFSPDSQKVVTVSSDKTARLWYSHNGQFIRILKGHQAGITQAAFSPDGKKLITVSGDGKPRLWNMN